MATITATGSICNQCGHEWVPRHNQMGLPKVCPKCKSPKWNTPKETPANNQQDIDRELTFREFITLVRDISSEGMHSIAEIGDEKAIAKFWTADSMHMIAVKFSKTPGQSVIVGSNWPNGDEAKDPEILEEGTATMRTFHRITTKMLRCDVARHAINYQRHHRTSSVPSTKPSG